MLSAETPEAARSAPSEVRKWVTRMHAHIRGTHTRASLVNSWCIAKRACTLGNFPARFFFREELWRFSFLVGDCVRLCDCDLLKKKLFWVLDVLFLRSQNVWVYNRRMIHNHEPIIHLKNRLFTSQINLVMQLSVYCTIFIKKIFYANPYKIIIIEQWQTKVSVKIYQNQKLSTLNLKKIE